MQTTQATSNLAGLVNTIIKTSHPHFHRRKKQHKNKLTDGVDQTISLVPTPRTNPIQSHHHITPKTEAEPEPNSFTSQAQAANNYLFY
jgi:hypothetical protein